MLSNLLVAWCLMALCVVIHASGVAAILRRFRPRLPEARRFWLTTWLFVRVAGAMVVLHLAEILVWALYYVWQDALPDLNLALYFSAVTYTTTGYGDVVLRSEWYLFSAVEALTGILLCGWSTGFFFAVVTRLLALDAKPVERMT